MRPRVFTAGEMPSAILSDAELRDIQLDALAEDVPFPPELLSFWDTDQVRDFFDSGGAKYYCPPVPNDLADAHRWWKKFHTTDSELLIRVDSLRQGIGPPLDEDECSRCLNVLEVLRGNESEGQLTLLGTAILQSMAVLITMGLGSARRQSYARLFSTFLKIESSASASVQASAS